MTAHITTAILLAAGKGTRMGGLTKATPKALLSLGKTRLIDHALDHLAASGVRRVIVNLNFGADELLHYLRGRTGVEIIFSDERPHTRDTGGALLHAAEALGDKPFFVHNCDLVYRPHPADLLARMGAQFDAQRMDASVLLVPVADAEGYEGEGDFHLADTGRITLAPPAPFIYAGIQIMHPRLLEGLKTAFSQKPFPITKLWEGARLFGYRFDGRFIHAGTPDALRLAQTMVGEA